jgi:hypothetical protein
MVLGARTDTGVGRGEPERDLAQSGDGRSGDDADDFLKLDPEEFDGLGGGFGFVLQESQVDVKGPTFDLVGLVGGGWRSGEIGGTEAEQEGQQQKQQGVGPEGSARGDTRPTWAA